MALEHFTEYVDSSFRRSVVSAAQGAMSLHEAKTSHDFMKRNDSPQGGYFHGRGRQES